MRRRALYLALGLLAGLLAFPIRSTIVRTAMVLCAAMAVTLGLSLLPLRPRLAALGLAGLAAGVFAFPSRPQNPDRLRALYLQSVDARLGTRYVWGGEATLGIDCSGLVRLPLASAWVQDGLQRRDGAALLHAAALWWTDASAAELGRGFGRRLQLVGEFPNARAVEGAEPGDVAVTADGVHALVYAGDGRWIEADPRLGEVVALDAATDVSAWLLMPIRLMRWLEFAAADPTRPLDA